MVSTGSMVSTRHAHIAWLASYASGDGDEHASRDVDEHTSGDDDHGDEHASGDADEHTSGDDDHVMNMLLVMTIM